MLGFFMTFFDLKQLFKLSFIENVSVYVKVINRITCVLFSHKFNNL